MLHYELQHRVKNILATVSALASRMLRNTGTAEDFTRAFLGRLRAMAVTHELLSQSSWEGADLRQLIERVMSGPDRANEAISFNGPVLSLTPAAVTTLGMVLYELVTNATKHGALSTSGGRVEVSWQVAPGSDDHVILDWIETGGPSPAQSVKEAFGVPFVKRSVEYELQGQALMEIAPEGVHWTLKFPAKGSVQPG
jgi:two-component system, chemotaxis family, CheB/CheR fusion protein